MIALAIDTATDLLGIAARRDRVTATRLASGARRHARELAGLIDEALAELGGGWDDVGELLVADGPGSFTGLRVGVAFAKGASRARGLPIRTASTLMLSAWGGAGERRPVAVAAVAPALRGEVYAALYRVETDRIECLVGPRVVAPGEALGGPTPDRLVSRVAQQALGEWPWAAGVAYVSEAAGRSAEHLLDLREVSGGTRMVDDVAGWEPEYGRPAEAQARWERDHGRPLVDPSR
ncbi:MAG: tRNA (adenosine(37)-N6)-threonylcarbamoyltransferase complex dimerization subunit type 1 TsaB [Gemmatimonadales bacterium]